MILPQAFDAYFNAAKDDFSWVKELPEEELDAILAQISPKPVFHAPLMKHQKACFLLGIHHPRFFFILEMGTGKTLLTLELLSHFQRAGKFYRGIVLAPTEGILYGWEDEINDWKFDLKYTILKPGPSTDKWWAHQQADSGLIIATYPGLVSMVSDRVTPSGAKKGKLLPDPKRITQFCRNTQALILDESTRTANQQSLTFQVVRRMAGPMGIKFALAGRAFGRDPTPLWGQFYLIDGGDTLGTSLSFFREAFFTKKKVYWSKNPYAFEYIFDKRQEPQLNRMIKHRSIIYTIDECTKLPERVDTIRRVNLPDEAKAYYLRMIEEVKEAKGNLHEVKNIFIRMRQLSSGFISTKTDDERIEVEFDENPKLELLLELITDLPPGRKAIVFYDYTHSGRTIHDALHKAKIKNHWIWSGTKDFQRYKEEFDKGDVDVLVVNNKKGNYGLNLQAANYCLFFESPVGVIDRDQAERRTYRKGQTRTCFFYDLVVRGTVDEKILLFHKEGRDIYKAIVTNPSEVFV